MLNQSAVHANTCSRVIKKPLGRKEASVERLQRAGLLLNNLRPADFSVWEFLICHSFKKKFLEKVARYVTAVSYTPVIDPVTFSRKLFLKERGVTNQKLPKKVRSHRKF